MDVSEDIVGLCLVRRCHVHKILVDLHSRDMVQ